MPREGRSITGFEVRARRLAVGLNQQLLAEFLDVPQALVSRWELGGAPVPPGIDQDMVWLEKVHADLVDVFLAQAQTDGVIRVHPTGDSFHTGFPRFGRVPVEVEWMSAGRAAQIGRSINGIVVPIVDDAV